MIVNNFFILAGLGLLPKLPALGLGGSAVRCPPPLRPPARPPTHRAPHPPLGTSECMFPKAQLLSALPHLRLLAKYYALLLHANKALGVRFPLLDFPVWSPGLILSM